MTDADATLSRVASAASLNGIDRRPGNDPERTGSAMNPPLELEVERELDLAGYARLDRPAKCRPGCKELTVDGIDRRDVRPILEIEGFAPHSYARRQRTDDVRVAEGLGVQSWLRRQGRPGSQLERQAGTGGANRGRGLSSAVGVGLSPAPNVLRGVMGVDRGPVAGCCTQPYRGLLVLMVILNSTDLRNENNVVYDANTAHPRRWYAVKDLGASFGDTGVYRPSRNDLAAFESDGRWSEADP